MSDPRPSAGGIIERDGRVLLVHRDRYDDWTFPKGKLEAGETWEEAALREVEEETGLVCELGSYVGSTHYPFGDGTKEVRYYRMTSDGKAHATDEVDDVRWATIDEAIALASYAHDRELLNRLR